MSEVEKAGVLGAGMMGAEIALCFAMTGIEVVIKDITMDLAKRGMERAEKALERLVKKGQFDDSNKKKTLLLMHATDNYGLFSDVDFVIEAVVEDLKIKKDAFAEVDKICKPECLFATNTSSLRVTALATAVSEHRRGKFLGTHFFSPVSIMRLVEVIPGLETTEESVRKAIEVCRTIGKVPIRVKDVAGFAVNRLLHAMWIEAERCVEEGVATPEDIDTGCRLGLGHPIGPFALMDIVTNNLTLDIQEILHKVYGPRFMPRPILRQKVDAGHLGRRTGRGWYDYRNKK
ncbi:MAG: 3-hydroxyacyl-CoA dehydrogenase family protein [Deltaproteobacteria bacterium]|nr:3-hydroxyacyl-CoA dehydrogenase family protein [Deltaproteobacteria bacterium]